MLKTSRSLCTQAQRRWTRRAQRRGGAAGATACGWDDGVAEAGGVDMMPTLRLRWNWWAPALACGWFVGLGGAKESAGAGGAGAGKVEKATVDGQVAPLAVAVFNLASTHGASDSRWRLQGKRGPARGRSNSR